MSSNKLFKENSKSGRSTIKKKFMDLVDYECSICKNQGIHNNEKLVLELDHINGIRNDNRLNNLRLVCPNCHSQLKTSNIRKSDPLFTGSKKISETDVLELTKSAKSIREILLSLNVSDSGDNYSIIKKILTKNNIELKKRIIVGKKYRKGDNAWRYNDRPLTEKIEWPTDNELKKLVFEYPLTQLGEKLNISDVAIGKRCKRRKIDLPPQGYWIRIANGYSKQDALLSQKNQTKPMKKFSKKEVLVIRNLIESKTMSLRKIAKLYGVSHRTISDIKNKKTYKNIH